MLYPEEADAQAREAFGAGRRSGLLAGQAAVEEATRIRCEAERLLWAAVMSNGGTLRIHNVALHAFERGDYVSATRDPATSSLVLIAMRRETAP